MFIRSNKNNGWISVVLMGGFALVDNNKVTILVNEAEFGSVFSFLFYNYDFLRLVLYLSF